MRELLLIDILPAMKEKNLGRTAQLFIICIIAHYQEKMRAKGEFMDEFIFDDKDDVVYKVILREKDIMKKFNFSIDTLIKIRRELEAKSIMKIEFIRTVSRKKVFNANPGYNWLSKFQNYENEYTLHVKRIGRGELHIPIRIIYDKQLTYSEKLAIVWNYSIKKRLGRQPSYGELERESGISKRTIRNAMDKYPKSFSQD